MKDASPRAVTIMISVLAAVIFIMGGTTMLFWTVIPDTSLGDVFDRVRPYLPLRYADLP